MAFTSKNPKFDTVIYDDLVAASTPNPAAGSYKLINRNGVFFQKDSSGAETQISGSAESVHSVSANYTILNGDGFTTILVTTGATNRTITLPALASNLSRRITIKKVDSAAGSIVVDGNSSETIDGSAQYSILGIGQAVTLQADETGTEWHKIADKQNSLSYIHRYGGNGHGSGATFIRRFAGNFSESSGTGITDGSDATVGSIFTINENGIYSITWIDDRSTGTNTQCGVTKNDDAPNQTITNVTLANILVSMNYGPASGNNGVSMSWTGPLVEGDVIRAHDDSTFATTSDYYVHFVIAQVVKF